MLELIDPFQKKRTFRPPYGRIVSLIPSITESLFDLGAGEQLIGITAYCVSPRANTRNKTKIGGTKNPDIERIRKLNPDLIIANVEENRKEDVERLEEICDVYLNHPKSIADTKILLEHLSLLTGRNAEPLLSRIDRACEASMRKTLCGSVLYLIWYPPYWGIGENTYIADMLRIHGLHNIWREKTERYFPLQDQEIAKANPDIILLPSEPFRFRSIHAEEIALRFRETDAVRHSRVFLVDGRMTSWFGTRTAKGIRYLNKLLRSRPGEKPKDEGGRMKDECACPTDEILAASEDL